ncbi:MAG: M16 family metallopeptidase, partial [Ferruginibacter sp.]
MKKILSFVLFAFMANLTFSQTNIDRSNVPTPGPAPVVTIKDPVIFKLKNGMTILVVENHKLPKVNASLSIDAGPITEGNKAGVIKMMGAMLGEGTTKTTKADFDQKIDQMGATVSLSSSGGFTASLTRYFEPSFLMMAEALQSPAFLPESFDKLKKQTITGLKSSEKNAAAIASRVKMALHYGKQSPMGEFETETTIQNITLDDVKKAYGSYITPSRSYLTFVGDITPDNAKKLAEKAFGNWKGTTLTLPKLPAAPNVSKTEINLIDLPSAVQAEIAVSCLIENPMSNPDYHALMIANQIIGGGSESKLFMNLREKHGFTYGSYSSVGKGRYQSLFSAEAKVRTEKADSAVAEILREIENMRNGTITAEELQIAKAKYNGSFALGMEDPENAAMYASNVLINELPKDYYRIFLQKINAVTIADVQRVAKKYFSSNNARIILVGNAAKMESNLNRLGFAINKYDKFAEPVVAKPVDEPVTSTTNTNSADAIINRYITAIGGKDAALAVKTTKASFTSSIQGYTLTGTELRMAPNKRYTSISAGGMTVMETNFDGQQGFQAQQGQRSDMEEKEIKESQDHHYVIDALDYILSPGFTLTVSGKEKINGEEAHVIKIKKPSGKETTEYYSVQSG